MLCSHVVMLPGLLSKKHAPHLISSMCSLDSDDRPHLMFSLCRVKQIKEDGLFDLIRRAAKASPANKPAPKTSPLKGGHYCCRTLCKEGTAVLSQGRSVLLVFVAILGRLKWCAFAMPSSLFQCQQGQLHSPLQLAAWRMAYQAQHQPCKELELPNHRGWQA